MSHLFDTNTLLRRLEPNNPQAIAVKAAIAQLENQGEKLCIARQNLIEFRNTASRPLDKNGLGLAPDDADSELDVLEHRFTTLPENDRVYTIWRQLITAKNVSGKQVHDARLVAFMLVYGGTHILTFDGSDFRRFESLPPEIGMGIVVVDPNKI